jgi:hypothetical protein
MRRLCTHNRYYNKKEIDVLGMFSRRGFDTVEVRLIDSDTAYEVYVTGHSLTLQFDNLEHSRSTELLTAKCKASIDAINQKYDESKVLMKEKERKYLEWALTDARYI